jgi:hypothetical protein
MKTEITIMTGYHNDQPVTFKQTDTERVYRRTSDSVQQSSLGSITTAHKWLVAWHDHAGITRKRYFKTRKKAVEYAGKF